jgi:hypothetical protein
MERENEFDDYNLRVLIEDMQRRGSAEKEIEAAVRAATRRMDPHHRPRAHRPKRLGMLRARLPRALAR